MTETFSYWLLAAVGANLVGLAVVILWHSNNLMRNKEPLWYWFTVGTIGLVFHLMGLSFMIDASKNLFL